MNFIKFPVVSTNIFPLANSKEGGQLLSEYNLKVLDSIATNPDIEYTTWNSFTHSLSDFAIRKYSDDSGTLINSYTIEIMPGKGIINGHYVETLANMQVDLVEANAELQAMSMPPLKGSLVIGFRAYYSTQATMAGSMLVENENMMYEGIQVVIMPEEELVMPSDSPIDEASVNCHLLLGKFKYINGVITNVEQNEDKIKYISSKRIDNIDDIVSDSFVTKTGLNPKKLYTFAGKGTDPATGLDTWCDSTDSLMIWDNNPQKTLDKPIELEASFGVSTSGETVLVVPHKQVDGMIDSEGHNQYYKSKQYNLPLADFSKNTSGTVDETYTKNIKLLSEKLSTIYQFAKGKQIFYMDTLRDVSELPPLNPAWNIGDYVLVSIDYTVASASDTRSPSTLYAVVPGYVTNYTYTTTGAEDDATVPSVLTGVELEEVVVTSVPSTSVFGPNGAIVDYANYRGEVGKDYFVARYKYSTTDPVTRETVQHFKKYYYAVASSGPRGWSDTVLITGEIPLAQETVVGGFYNVPDNVTDGGYVMRNDQGYLQLVDYGLLRSGALAYQLGEDVTFAGGLSSEEIQSYLDEYVNDRVAFPNAKQLTTSDTPNVINIYMELPEEEQATQIIIRDIDSRFNTSVYFHFSGNANNKTTITILDCEKIRIDSNIGGSPVIDIFRSKLYYDASIFNYITTCERSDASFTGFQDLSIWYQKYTDTDPQLLVDGMTISELNSAIEAEGFDFWNAATPNDNHYLVALYSITFSGSGTIVKCGLLVANESTENIELGHKIVAGTFTLPQGSGLTYPQSCLTKQLKVTGSFVSAYYTDDSWIVDTTNFTAMSDVYSPYSTSPTVSGTIAFSTVTDQVHADFDDNIESGGIAPWETDSYHLFYGGVIN